MDGWPQLQRRATAVDGRTGDDTAVALAQCFVAPSRRAGCFRAMLCECGMLREGLDKFAAYRIAQRF